MSLDSWHTANNELNEINEHLQKRRVSSDLENGPKQNEQIYLKVQNDQHNELHCCREYFYRFKGLYSWRMPWITVLLSVVQVCDFQSSL